jgi:hypothetical protein
MVTDSADVIPIPTNQAPALDSIGPQDVAEGDTLSLPVSASDPDGTVPDLAAENLPANSAFADNGDGTGLFEFYPDFDQAAIYDVVFIASDGSLADTESVVVTVTETNRPPVLDSIGPQDVAEGDTIDFIVTASDPDGTVPNLIAEGLPLNAVFSDLGDGTGTFEFHPDFDQSGTYPVLFYAIDEHSDSDSELVVVTVANTNRGPQLDPIGDKTGSPGELMTFVVTAEDPDDDSVVLAADNLPDEASFDYNGWDPALEKYKGTFTWMPDVSDVGVHGDVHFMATDGLLMDQAYITITISGGPYLCGDANASGEVDIDDVVYVIAYIFSGGPEPVPYESGDVNCLGGVDIDDVVWLIAYIFSGGNSPCDTDGDGLPDC